MVTPLVLLAIGSAVAGLFNTPFRPGLEHFLEPAFEGVEMAHLPSGITPWVLSAASVAVALFGAYYGLARYRGAATWDRSLIGDRFTGFWRWVRNGYYVDDIIGNFLVLPGKLAAAWTAFAFDTNVVDGSVRAIGGGVRKVGSWMRPLQTGFVRSYAAVTFVGVVGLMIWFVARGIG
jgi:NADH-quinone oxidoreductase subunit L